MGISRGRHGGTALRVAIAAAVLAMLPAARADEVWPPRDRKKTFLYKGRVLPVRYERKVKAWERKDSRMRGWADAYKTKSKHYKIETNVPRFIVELEIKPFLDELYATYKRVFRQRFGLKGRAANGKRIRIFHRYETYAKQAKPGTVVPRSNPGFIRNGEEIVLFYEDTCPEVFYGTMFHEGAHQFVKNLMPAAQMPVWLDEALAVTFEGCSYSLSKRKIQCGFLPPDRLADAQRILAGAQAPAGVSLANHLFMRLPKTHFRAPEYALAWSFLHYAVNREDGRWRSRFTRFLLALNGSGAKEIDAVFKKKMGVELREFERGWRDFVLAQPKPELRWWVLIDVEQVPEGVDLRTDDRIVSIDGRPVESFDAFERVWTKGDANKDARWVVVRTTPGENGAGAVERLVETVVPAGAETVIHGRRSRRRAHNLVR